MIVAFGGKPVASVDDLQRLLTQLPVGVAGEGAWCFARGGWLERTAMPARIPDAVRG